MKRWTMPALVALAVLAAGTAVAAIPSAGGGVINACYKPFGGALRLIDADAGQTCSKKEEALAWNAQGPKGDKGDKGDTGDPGPPGPPGAGGVGDVYTVRHGFTNLEPVSFFQRLVSRRVPPGDYVLLVDGELLGGGNAGLAGTCALYVDENPIETSSWSSDGSSVSVSLLAVTEIEGSPDPLAPNPLVALDCVSSVPGTQAQSFEIAAVEVETIR